GEAGHVGPAQLGPHGQAIAGDERRQQRVVQAGGGGGGHVEDLDAVPVGQRRCEGGPHRRLGGGRVAVGGEPVVDDHGGGVGHHVAGHAPLDLHGLEGLAELAAVEHGTALVEGLHRGEDRAQPVD